MQHPERFFNITSRQGSRSHPRNTTADFTVSSAALLRMKDGDQILPVPTGICVIRGWADSSTESGLCAYEKPES
ncbi:hypothetical protein CIB48_g3725 [Xylaria polymorpha]|nr:hypothetical protein CIB48_g3725 [Xylaria polymorpha]